MAQGINHPCYCDKCYVLPPKPPGAGAPNGAGAGAPKAGVEFAEEPNPPPEEPNGVLEPNMLLISTEFRVSLSKTSWGYRYFRLISILCQQRTALF